MNFPFFVAKHIRKRTPGKENFARPAIVIATLGVAIGVAVMIISISVVLGFQREISDKVSGFCAHLRVMSCPPRNDASQRIPPVIMDCELKMALDQTPHLRHYQVYAEKAAMMKNEEDFLAIQVKGVGEDFDASFFQKNLVKGEIPKFSSKQASKTDRLLVSQTIASTMKLDVGDTVRIYYINEEKEEIEAYRFVLGGIYQTNLAQFDKMVCLADLYVVRKNMNKWKDERFSSGVEIELDNMDKMDEAADVLAANVNHSMDTNDNYRMALTVKELQPHIFAWLDVLGVNVWMILILMLAIGGFTVMAGLLIVMLDRIQMIGILKALGTTNMSIRLIFSNFAMMIVGVGMLIGNVIGIGLCVLQQQCEFIHLDPQTYYIDTMPIELNWWYLLLVNIGVLIMSAIIVFGASFIMGIKAPARTMKWE